MQVQDEARARASASSRKTVGTLVDEGNASGKVTRPRSRRCAPTSRSTSVEIDRTKAKTLGLSLSDVFGTLQVFLGGYYVNDFNRFGPRVPRARAGRARRSRRAGRRDAALCAQREGRDGAARDARVGEADRRAADDRALQPVPVRVDHRRGGAGPQLGPGDPRHGGARESRAARGHDASSGRALSLQELRAGGTAPILFGLALVVVFLCLAALYESWILPLTIMLVVPLAVLGALLAQWLRGLANDVFCQVGLVMLVGLASKNAILVVEFAKALREQGESIERAAIHAARVRLRPILMTSFAFILGVLPLVLASGRRRREPPLARHRRLRRDAARDVPLARRGARVLRRDGARPRALRARRRRWSQRQARSSAR